MKRKLGAMYCCSLCEYTAKCPSYLARHMLRHTRDKQFPCEVCGVLFRTVSERNMHRRIHDSAEHACAICNFKTPLKKVLDRHMLVHEEEKHIQCPRCNYRCRRLMDLKKHIVSMRTGRPLRKRYEEACCALLSEMSVPYEREVTIQFPCSAKRKYARVDIFLRTAFGTVIFEVDEYAHRGSRYDVEYECQRMALIHSTISAKFGGCLHIIRYNPHPVRGKAAPTKEEQEDSIRSTLAFEPPSGTALVITYLFYHARDDGYPEIVMRPEYTLKEHVRLQGPVRPHGATSL